jgi:aconitate hydratase
VARPPSREPRYSEELSLDLSTVVPSIAGPKRPQDRIALADAKTAFRDVLPNYVEEDSLDNGLDGTFPASDPVERATAPGRRIRSRSRSKTARGPPSTTARW